MRNLLHAKSGVVVMIACLAVIGIALVAYRSYPGDTARTLTTSEGTLTVQFVYPEFGYEGIDTAIRALRDTMIADFVGSATVMRGGPATLEGAYEIVYRSRSEVSILFTAVLHTAAAGRDVTTVAARTFTFKEDRMVPYGELLPSGWTDEDLRHAIRFSLEVDGKFDESYLGLRLEEAGALEQTVRTGSTLTTYFSPGQVLPADAGIISVSTAPEAVRK